MKNEGIKADLEIWGRKKKEGQDYGNIGNCKYCKKDFLAVRITASYCSDYCRLAYHRRKKKFIQRMENMSKLRQRVEEIKNKKTNAI